MQVGVTSGERAFIAQKLALADCIRHDGRLSASIRIIGAEMCSLTNFRTGYSWASEKFLAEKLSLADRTIKRAVVALKDAGWITVERVGRSNRYRPNFAALEQQTICPLLETGQGTISHLSSGNGGQNGTNKGTNSTGNRGQKGPPISLETSLGISARRETGAGGAAPVGAAGPSYDLGVPGVLLRQRLGEDVFRSWFGKVAFVSTDDGELTLSAPTKFLASRLMTNFAEQIVQCWRLDRDGIDRLRITVAPPNTPFSTLRPDNPDARWLVDAGIDLVADRLHVTRHAADKTIQNWLVRCGPDVLGLRGILEQAGQLDLDKQQFAAVVRQHTKTLLHADQLRYQAPVGLKRSSARA